MWDSLMEKQHTRSNILSQGSRLGGEKHYFTGNIAFISCMEALKEVANSPVKYLQTTSNTL